MMERFHVMDTGGTSLSLRKAWFRGCCWLLLALALEVVVSGTEEAAGPSLADYFRACGIGDDAFAKFADDRQVADEELDVIRRIAVRLRDCRAGQIGNLPCFRQVGALPHVLPSPAEAKGQRGRMLELQGSLAAVEPVEDQGGEPLWRCTVTLALAGSLSASGESPRRAVVYAAEVPEKLRAGSAGQRVAVTGVFLKYVPGTTAEPTAVIVAPRLEWRAESPLGNLGMDFGLLEGIQDDAALTAADRDAFYRLLQLARDADPARLGRDAEGLDASSQGLPALFHDPASQRGRLVWLSGTARRVVRVPIDDPAVVARLGTDHYFEIDLVAEGSQNNPLVFCTLDLPAGMPLGGPPSYGESLEVTGFFLKNWQYPTELSQEEKAANPGSSQALQTAPLLIGRSPLWKRRGRSAQRVGLRVAGRTRKEVPPAAAVGGLLALAIVAVCLLLWSFRQSDQKYGSQQ